MKNKTLYSEKREQVLILNSSPKSILTSSIITSTIFTLLFYLIHPVLGTKLSPLMSIGVHLLYWMSGLLTGEILLMTFTMYERQNLTYRPPLLFFISYIFLFFYLFAILPKEILLPASSEALSETVSKTDPTILTSMILGVLLLNNFLYRLVKFFFFLFLEPISGKDHKLLIMRMNLFQALNFKFYEMKRYGGLLSFIMIKALPGTAEKIPIQSNKVLRKILEALQQKMRESDIISDFQNGEIIAMLSMTDKAGAHLAAERMMAITRDALTKLGYSPDTLKFHAGISRFRPEMQDHMDFVREAQKALNSASSESGDFIRIADDMD